MRQFPILTSSQTDRDIEDAFGWYEEQRSGLGQYFLNALRTHYNKISANLRLTAVLRDGVRRVNIRRFPYAIYFIAREDRVEVIAVLHVRRSPQVWQRRTEGAS